MTTTGFGGPATAKRGGQAAIATASSVQSRTQGWVGMRRASRASSDPWCQRRAIAFQTLESGGVFQQFCDLVFAGQTSRAPPHMPTIRCGDRMANVD